MFYRLALIIGLVCGLGSALAASEELAATVLRTTGKGKVVLPGGGPGEFKAGTLLRAGSRVITEESSVAVLVLEDGSRVNVGPNTDLTITELNRDGGKNSTVFELLRGIFKASVQKLTVGSRFEVKTSDAVAAVKGTEYEVEVTDSGTDARVKEGTVWLEDPKRERQVVIHEHQTARAGHHGDLGESREMRRDEAERFGAWAKENLPQRSGSKDADARDARMKAFWEALKPADRLKVLDAFHDSFREVVDEVTEMRSEEREALWKQRLHDADERHLAGEESKVDFALRKSGIDRLGRRVRFEEFLLRPAADQLQFINYTRREGRTDYMTNLKTYNQSLPRLLGEARGLNQQSWDQMQAPQYWVLRDVTSLGNSQNDNLAAINEFFDPTLVGPSRWVLPLRFSELRLNVSDPLVRVQAAADGILLERYVRSQSPTVFTQLPGGLNTNAGVTTNRPNNYIWGGAAVTSNMVWDTTIMSNSVAPAIRFLDASEMGTQAGDFAVGWRKTYNGVNLGQTLDFRTYAIDENGQVLNIDRLKNLSPVDAFIQLGFRTFQELQINSSAFNGDIDVVSQLLWMHNISKSTDDL